MKKQIIIPIIIIIVLLLMSVGFLKYREFLKNKIAREIELHNLDFKTEKPITGAELVSLINKIKDYNEKHNDKIDLDIVVDIDQKEYEIPLSSMLNDKKDKRSEFLESFGKARFMQTDIEYYPNTKIKKSKYRIVYNF